jgi:hypothetical protein
MRYPYPSKQITIRQAVEFVAAVVYPDEHQRSARNKVRSRISYACKKGSLPFKRMWAAATFFRWAISNAEWVALRVVEGLPVAPVESVSAIEDSISMTEDVSIILIPGDLERLRQEYVRVEGERQHLLKRINDLESEVTAWREKDRQLREMRSKSGKKAWRAR